MNRHPVSLFSWLTAVLLVGLLLAPAARSEDEGTRSRGHQRDGDHAHHHEGEEAGHGRRKGQDRDMPQWEDHAGNDHARGPHDRKGRDGDRHARSMRRPGGDARRGGHGPAGRGRLSEAETQKFRQYLEQRLEILREVNPPLAERIEHHLEQRGDTHPERIRMMLRERFQRIERLVQLKQEDPDAYELAITDMKLEWQSRQMAEKIRRADAGADAQREELRTLIQQHFDVRQRKYEHELQRLEQRIAELRGQLETRRAHRSALEQTRFNELVSTPGRPEW